MRAVRFAFGSYIGWRYLLKCPQDQSDLSYFVLAIGMEYTYLIGHKGAVLATGKGRCLVNFEESLRSRSTLEVGQIGRAGFAGLLLEETHQMAWI